MVSRNKLFQININVRVIINKNIRGLVYEIYQVIFITVFFLCY